MADEGIVTHYSTTSHSNPINTTIMITFQYVLFIYIYIGLQIHLIARVFIQLCCDTLRTTKYRNKFSICVHTNVTMDILLNQGLD